MKGEIDLGGMERGAYASYHEDGLIDIFWGLGIVGFVETVFFDMPSTASIIPALAIICYTVAKKKITIPRIGYVKFGKSGSRSLILFQGLLLASLLLGLAFGVLVFLYLDHPPAWMRMVLQEFPHLFAGCGGALLFFSCAYATGIRRFYVYAALTLALFLGGWALGIEARRIALVCGLAMMGTGIVTLRKFVRTHPLREDG